MGSNLIVLLACIAITVCTADHASNVTCAMARELLNRPLTRKLSCEMVAGMPILKYRKPLRKLGSCRTIPGMMAVHGYNVSDCLVVNGDDSKSKTAYFRVDQKLSWDKAWAACHSIDQGNLATVRNFAEYLAVIELAAYQGERFAWLGLHDIGGWRWTDNGETALYTKWFPGEPDGNDRCAIVGFNKELNQFGWNDVFCGRLHKPLCKLPV